MMMRTRSSLLIALGFALVLTCKSPALAADENGDAIDRLPASDLIADSELDNLFSDPKAAVRAPASAFPAELEEDFVVSAPEREPASVRARRLKAAAHLPPKVSKTDKRPASTGKAAAVSGRRSRLPASVTDGFELRVRYNQLTTMFWVVKRGTKYDLMFANSSGSRASLSLSELGFKQLHQVAQRLPASENSIAKCKDSSMQMHVVTAGKAENSLTMCVADKSKSAETMRQLGQSLAAMVR